MGLKKDKWYWIAAILWFVVVLLTLNQYGYRILRVFSPGIVHIDDNLAVEVPDDWIIKKCGNVFCVFASSDGCLLFRMDVGDGQPVPSRMEKAKERVEAHNGYLINFKIEGLDAYERSYIIPSSPEPVIFFTVQRGMKYISARYYGRVTDKYNFLKKLINSIRDCKCESNKDRSKSMEKSGTQG
ncbi:MAG: hypothetical protein GXO69_00350 [Acidobacteria bacterium]|nr:hypothetical protein [Acidobacteriota bacterium]